MQNKLFGSCFVIILLIINNLTQSCAQSSNAKNYSLKVGIIKAIKKGTNQYLKIPVTFTNNTNDTLKYLSMTCAPLHCLYRIDNKAVTWADTINCISNIPHFLELAPHNFRRDSLLLLVKDHNKLPVTYKVGFYLAKNEGKNPWYFLMERKKLDFIIIWSKTTQWNN